MVKKNNLTRKDWLEYINNLNCREISKRSSSGITTWALLSLIGFILFEIINSLPIILMDTLKLFLTKLFIANIFNSYIIIFLLILVLAMPLEGKRKIYNTLMKKIFPFGAGTMFIIIIFSCISNINIIKIVKYYGLHAWPYWIFNIFEIIFMISFIISLIIIKKNNKMPRIDSGYLYSKKRKNPIKKAYIFFFLFLSIPFLFSIYQILQIDAILGHLNVLRFVIYLNVLIIVIIICVLLSSGVYTLRSFL